MYRCDVGPSPCLPDLHEFESDLRRNTKNTGKNVENQRGKQSIEQDPHQLLIKSQAIQEVHQAPRTIRE
jgi:hypothetical protein